MSTGNRRPELKLVKQVVANPNQLPPHDELREQALIAAMLTDGRVADLIVDLVTQADFYDAPRGMIFDAIMQLRGAGSGISIVSVVEWLKDRGTLAAVGGPGVVARLKAETPVIGHAIEHARKIALKSRRRAFILDCQQAAIECAGDIGDEVEWLDRRTKEIKRHADGLVAHNAVSLRQSMVEFFDQLNIDTSRNGVITGYSTGLKELDAVTAGWQGGDITLIGGATGQGKSAFAGCQAVNVASKPQRESVEYNGGRIDYDVPIGVAFFSLEMRRKKLAQRLCCGLARVNYKQLQVGNGGQHDVRELIAASKHLSNLPIYIDDSPDLTMARFEAKVARIEAMFAAMGVRLGLVILDYMQLVDVDGDGDKNSNRELRLNLAGRRLQKFASTFTARPRALPVIDGKVVDAGHLDPSLVSFGVLIQLNDEGAVRESKALAMHAHGFWVLEPSTEEPQGPGLTRRAAIRIKKQREGDTNVLAHFWGHAAYTLYTDDER